MLAAAPTSLHSCAMADTRTASETSNKRSFASKLNWLRAGVLGANDGIVSTAGLVFGVAGAKNDPITLLIAGLAGLVAGALSMAGGEYVSVSSQRDTERAALARVSRELEESPEEKLTELVDHYVNQGLSDDAAMSVARELTDHDALQAHARAQLGMDADEQTSPIHAAIASMVAFTLGAIIPLVTIVVTPAAYRLPLTVAAVLVALLLTGVASARLGGARPAPPMIRNVVIGSLAMGLTYLVGMLVGSTI